MMIQVEVNVGGTTPAEIEVVEAKKEIRMAIAGVCGLGDYNNRLKLSFHLYQTNTSLDNLVQPCELLFEIIIYDQNTVILPRADQLRDRLMDAVPKLKKFKVGISVPGQCYLFNSAVWQAEQV